MHKGVKPIEKNIIVADEFGNEYGATYLKRAKGLVKNGRARFVAENKICLACPPGQTEDYDMSDNNIMKATQPDAQNGNDTACAEAAVREQAVCGTEVPEGNTVPENGKRYHMDYVLSRIEKIAEQAEYLDGVISELRQMETGVPGDVAGASKAEALKNIVCCRETTNQKLLAFYEKMYDDLKPENELKAKALELMSKMNCGDENAVEAFGKTVTSILGC